ncbi:MAG: HAMP domain-containing histidine kinase [Methylococcaceae bacterium]|nr:HAMP domain-containing histidine kinase [Methylococcaceae bacterium]
MKIDTSKSQTLFPTILACTVHDIKNSLGIVLELIRQLAIKQQAGQSEEFSQLEFEANRINHSLMQLLVMYKIDSRKFNLDIDEYPALEIINEARAQQDVLSKLNSVQVRIDCNDDLFCFCDYPNVSNALGTILNNALRYTHSSISISAAEEEGYIKFCIEDDGEGYPEHLLAADLSDASDLDWVKGNTGLGLYFVAMIAGLHRHDDKTGYVRIDNRSSLGGARFCLFLP